MKRFNLSAWAVQHPALVLFLILRSASAASRPSAPRPRRGPELHHQGRHRHGDLARRDGAGDAGPGRRPDREEAAGAALLRQGQTYTKPSFTAMQVEFRDNTPAREVPQLFYQLRKKLDDIRAELPAGLIGPERQRRIRRRRFHPLHADRRRRRLRAAEDAWPRRCASSCSRCQTSPRSISTACRTRRSSSSSATPSSRRSAFRRRRSSIRSRSRTPSCRPARSRPARSACRCASPARSTGRKAVAETPVEADGACFRLGDIATVTRGFEDPPTSSCASAASRRSASASSWPRAPTSSAFGEDVEGRRPTIHADAAAGHRHRADRRPAACRRPRDQRIRALVRRGAGHRAPGRRSCRSAGAPASWWRSRCRWCSPSPSSSMSDARHRPAPHHARRADHRARPARRRRHHRGRDDGGEDGAGLGPDARRLLRLDLDRLPDAHRHARDGGRLPAGRLRQFGGRRICRRHLLGRRHRADRVAGSWRWSSRPISA